MYKGLFYNNREDHSSRKHNNYKYYEPSNKKSKYVKQIDRTKRGNRKSHNYIIVGDFYHCSLRN